MGKDGPLCMCRFILRVRQCCDSHEDDGFAFHWSGQEGHQKFPMSYLSKLELVQCGDYKGLVARGTDRQPTILSFVWMDRDRHYFIASASSLDSGIPYSRNRCCQVSLELDAPPENMELTILQHKATEVYYRTFSNIDQHNQHCQDNLKTEKKLETKKWDMRVNLTIFSMIVLDTWLVYSQATGSTELQSECYVRLAEELIDNNIDSQLQHRRRMGVTATMNLL